MRSHLATRSARLVLAVTATVALAAGLTACDSDDDTATASGNSTQQPASSTTGGTGTPAASSPGSPAATTGGNTNPTGSTGTTGSAGSTDTTTNGSGSSGNSNSSGDSGGSNSSNSSGGSGSSGSSNSSGGSSGQSDADDQPARQLGDACRNGDLEFSVSAGDGGYLLVTAKAQNHLSCRLDSTAPQVIFNSSERTKPYPAELLKLTPPDTMEVDPTTAAYAVLIPNTTRAEGVVEVDTAEISIGGEGDPTFINLPGTYGLSDSSVTAWYPSPEAATPDAN